MGKGTFKTVGRHFCNFGLFVIGLAVLAQALNNLFYVQSFDRLLYLSMAFIVTFALCWMLRAMGRQAERRVRRGTRQSGSVQAAG